MNSGMATKIEMYHEVEKVCAANHMSWNISDGFASMFSKFVAKLTRLEHMRDLYPENQLIDLMIEIDSILNNSLDALVSALKPKDVRFYDTYQQARLFS